MTNPIESENSLIEQETNEVVSDLDAEAQLKLEVIQTLLNHAIALPMEKG